VPDRLLSAAVFHRLTANSSTNASPFDCPICYLLWPVKTTYSKNMNVQTTIITIMLAALLAGCGVRKEDHRKVLNELAQTKRQLRTATTEVSELRNGEVTRLLLELKRASDLIAGLRAEIDRLKKQDVYTFTEAGKLLDAGDLSAALQA